MTRAIAIAAVQQENPFKSAVNSAENFAKFAVNFLYGTPKRIEYTMAAMMALLTLSLALSAVSKTVLQTCPI